MDLSFKPKKPCDSFTKLSLRAKIAILLHYFFCQVFFNESEFGLLFSKDRVDLHQNQDLPHVQKYMGACLSVQTHLTKRCQTHDDL